MDNFFIKSLVVGNIANIHHLSFASDGNNIIITGQNGAGKTTLGKSLLWALTGSTADGEKFIPRDDSGMPFVEIELSNGKSVSRIRKEIVKRIDKKGVVSVTCNCFVAGLPVKEQEVKNLMAAVLPLGILDIMLTPSGFFRLTVDAQRRFLTEHFGQISDEEILSGDNSLGDLNLGNFSVYDFIVSNKKQLRRLKDDALKIEPQIELLQEQIIPDSPELLQERQTLQSEISSLKSALAELDNEIKAKSADVKSRQTIETRISKGEFFIEKTQREIADSENHLALLRRQYLEINDICPACRQKINGGIADKLRNDITSQGLALKKKIEELNDALVPAQKLLDDLKAELDNKNVLNNIEELFNRRQNLYDYMKSRRSRLDEIESQSKRNTATLKHIEQLRVSAKEIGRKISAVEKQINLAERFIQKKMSAVTDSINSHFKFVKFRMFETLKNGEVRNVCEATLNGIPYKFLSKGECLKVALDFLNAVENYYRVSLPVIIDDAESYTSNSLPELSNQLILMKVVEGEKLTVSIENFERSVSA